MNASDDQDRDPHVLSVGQLTALIKDVLEGTFPAVWVSGELSDVSRPRSGHVYFTLKDADAQIRGVIWRNTASRVPFDLEDGAEVVCGGSLDVYPPRGSYQLVVREIEPRGVGSLLLALRQLQQRLAAEGLFDPEHKSPLPRFPRRIAFVTSPTGAAIRDFLEVLRRRWRGVEVLVVPTRVQGEGAAGEIAKAIAVANHVHPAPDVIVVGRGGGSVEDLWCFNDELVVRAIFASEVPVVSAVGHEIDVTLSDLVADVRALTPSEAAELVVPSSDDLKALLVTYQQRLVALLRNRAQAARSRLDLLTGSRVLRQPTDRIRELARRVDELEMRATRAVSASQSKSRDRIGHMADRLESLSPLAVLGRGYSLTQRATDGELVTDASSVSIGDVLTMQLCRGTLTSRVEAIEPEPEG
ncbi:MAG: exodeoxyribonuclease VII large subunit [Planctomycetes bacterium]|nr:exodeoxyribonuclease VII large subunit [Planctomycetota bacterium]